MHYYQFNIADYRKRTNHLSHIEHYIYRELLDLYYLDEKPLDNNPEHLARLMRLSGDQSTVVQQILGEFFELKNNSWHNDRADEEIQNYALYLEKQRANGKLGGRPKNPEKPTALSGLTQPEPKKSLTTNHKPLTTNHKDQKQGVQQADAPLPSEIDSSKNPPVPYSKIVDLYHEILTPLLPSVGKLTDTRKRYIRNLWNDPDTGLPDINNWKNFFDYVADSPFLTGKADCNNGRRPFRANLEWLTKPSNFVKISEEQYHG